MVAGPPGLPVDWLSVLLLVAGALIVGTASLVVGYLTAGAVLELLAPG